MDAEKVTIRANFVERYLPLAVSLFYTGAACTRNRKRAAGSPVILRPLGLQEFDRAAQFVQAVHAVLDGDPAGEVDAPENPEDRVVIVEPLAGFAVAQLVGVAEGAVGLPQFVEGCAGQPESGRRRAWSRRAF